MLDPGKGFINPSGSVAEAVAVYKSLSSLGDQMRFAEAVESRVCRVSGKEVNF